MTKQQFHEATTWHSQHEGYKRAVEQANAQLDGHRMTVQHQDHGGSE